MAAHQDLVAAGYTLELDVTELERPLPPWQALVRLDAVPRGDLAQELTADLGHGRALAYSRLEVDAFEDEELQASYIRVLAEVIVELMAQEGRPLPAPPPVPGVLSEPMWSRLDVIDVPTLLHEESLAPTRAAGYKLIREGQVKLDGETFRGIARPRVELEGKLLEVGRREIQL